MRILYLDFDIPYLIKDADYPVGGAAVEWLNWIKGFRANADEVGILSWKGVNKYLGSKSSEYQMVETYGVDEGTRYLRIVSLRLPRLIKAIASYQPDVVIQGCAALNTGLLCMAARSMRVPFVYRAANDMDADDRYRSRMSSLEAFFYQYGLRKADAIICQNKYQYQAFKKQFPNKPIIILHNPYEVCADRTEPKPFSDRKYIAWLGVFQQQKNLPALYKIVKALPHYQFRLGGKVTKSKVDEATRQALGSLKEAPNVTFEGYIKRTNIGTFLSNAYLLLNTSHYEGFSNTFLEAFAAGTPIVTTRKVDPDSIIEHNQLGFTSEFYEGLSACIQQVITNDNYDKMSFRCQNYVVEKHNPTWLASQFADFLANLPGLRVSY